MEKHYDPEVRPAPRKSPDHNPFDDGCGGLRLCQTCRDKVEQEARIAEMQRRYALMRDPWVPPPPGGEMLSGGVE
jgi:hypothetical protein